jgi:hypothetical protein
MTGHRPRNRRVVYYGPGFSGKTSNVEFLATCLPDGPQRLQRMVSVENSMPFEFLACEASELGLNSPDHLQILTVPGRYLDIQARQTLLQQVDAVVFVADSRPDRLDANMLLLDELGSHLTAISRVPPQLDLVLQYNHADARDALSVAQLDEQLNRHRGQRQTASAAQGVGVLETLALVCGIDPPGSAT